MGSRTMPSMFRDPDLATDAALAALKEAASSMVRAALDARLSLLSVGFADVHSMCVELAGVAERWTAAEENVIRQILAEMKKEA